MKSSEIKVGREYVVKVGGKYGFTAKEKVTEIVGKIFFTRGGYGEKCRRVARNFVKPVELTQERKMDLLVAFVDGFSAVPHAAPEHLAVAVQVLSAQAVKAAATPETRTPVVVSYTNEGLPLTAAALDKIEAESVATQRARVYVDAMNH
jgi:hypothetical protein